VKIERVLCHVLEANLQRPFGWSTDSTSIRRSCIVEIVTDEGVTGWGECFGPAGLNAAVVEAYASCLVGLDPLRTEWIWAMIYNKYRDQGQKGLIVTALSGVDIALWDIKGKVFNAPIASLMGGPMRNEVRAYATGTYRLEHGDPLDYIVEEVAAYQKQGFSGAKIKIGFDVNADAELIRACRKRVGPQMALMLDANHGYDALEAIQLGRMVAECGIEWFEEPVVPEDLESYRQIRDRQPIPVAGGECEFTRWGFLDVLTSRSIDIIQPDTCAAGGLSECKKIADMATAFGVRYVPHVWGTAIGLSAALQLLAVLPDTPTRRTPREPWLEFDRSEHPFRQAVVTRPIEHVNGIVKIPSGPGLGIEIDRAGLERFRVTR